MKSSCDKIMNMIKSYSIVPLDIMNHFLCSKDQMVCEHIVNPIPRGMSYFTDHCKIQLYNDILIFNIIKNGKISKAFAFSEIEGDRQSHV